MARRNSKKESKLQTLVSDYVRTQYPDAEFRCDVAAGMRFSIGMAVLVLRWRSRKSLPDMDIYERRGQWAMLQLELKTEEADLYKKDGTLRKNEHNESQQAMHIKFRNKGYYACFGKGFDHCRAIIDWYMSGCVGEPPKYVKKNLPKLF